MRTEKSISKSFAKLLETPTFTRKWSSTFNRYKHRRYKSTFNRYKHRSKQVDVWPSEITTFARKRSSMFNWQYFTESCLNFINFHKDKWTRKRSRADEYPVSIHRLES
jgi:hypothetical protein